MASAVWLVSDSSQLSVSQSGGYMKIRSMLVVVAVCVLSATMCFAADPNIGTWKLNEAKSKIDAGVPKNMTVTYEAAGDSIKATVDGVDAQGKPTHNEWTGKYDGKDYPVTGDAYSDSRSLKRIDDRTLELSVKKDGKVMMSGKIVLAADGKSRTLTLSGTSAAGKKIHSTSVYDKQ
jgi:hypothetical protein